MHVREYHFCLRIEFSTPGLGYQSRVMPLLCYDEVGFWTTDFLYQRRTTYECMRLYSWNSICISNLLQYMKTHLFCAGSYVLKHWIEPGFYRIMTISQLCAEHARKIQVIGSNCSIGCHHWALECHLDHLYLQLYWINDDLVSWMTIKAKCFSWHLLSFLTATASSRGHANSDG